MASGNRPTMQKERIIALTDGVLAIVLTILVLSFEVPEHEFGHDALIDFFRKLARPFAAYIVSFGVVATYWMQHTAIFHYAVAVNRILVWLNVLFMLPLTLLPFLTDLRVAYHGEYVTTLMYAGANICCSVFLLVIWNYGKRRGLLRTLAPKVDRSMRSRIFLGLAINALGAAVAPINTYLSSAVFLLVPCVYLSHRIVDSNWQTDGGDGAPALE